MEMIESNHREDFLVDLFALKENSPLNRLRMSVVSLPRRVIFGNLTLLHISILFLHNSRRANGVRATQQRTKVLKHLRVLS